MKKKIRIGVLVSGGGSNLQAIMDACAAGRIDGKVVCVGADSAEAGGLERARGNGIPTFVVAYADLIRRYREAGCRPEALPPDFDLTELRSKQSLFPVDADPEKVGRFLVTRALAEAALLGALRPHACDLIVLAGFMRTLSPYFIDRAEALGGRPCIMNIHPALLPAFPGVDGYGDTLRYGCKVGGCTVHFVDYGEDSGPIIGQRAFAIEPDDTLESVKAKGLKQEWELYAACIQLFAQNRLQTVRMTYTLPGGRVVQRTVVKVVQTEEAPSGPTAT